MKKLLLFLMSFGFIVLMCVVDVNAQSGYPYYVDAFDSGEPPDDDLYYETWVESGIIYLEGYYDFIVSFEIENAVSLSDIKVVTFEDFVLTFRFSQNMIMTVDESDDMEISCEMILYGFTDFWNIDVSDEGYQLLTEGIEFENMESLYPAEKSIDWIDFVFEIEFSLQGIYLGYDEVISVEKEYELGLYYNPSIYDEAYDAGYDEGFRDGFWEGFDEGFEVADNPETRGFSAMLVALWTAISGFLGIKLFWDISIGAIILIPIVFGLIAFILGKRGD